MRRRLFNFAAAGALALCVATVGLWVRSYWIKDMIAKPWSRPETQTDHYILLESNQGRVVIHYDSVSYDDENLFRALDLRYPKRWVWQCGPAQRAGVTPGFWHSIGFQYDYSATQDPEQNHRWLVTPHWLWVFVSAILPVIWFASTLRAWRAPKPHQCQHCRYNLTGNTSGVCPECGTPVAGKEALKA